MQLCTVRSSFIIGRRTFLFMKLSRSSDPIDYLLCNQCGLNLSVEDADKANGP